MRQFAMTHTASYDLGGSQSDFFPIPYVMTLRPNSSDQLDP